MNIDFEFYLKFKIDRGIEYIKKITYQKKTY